MWQDDAFQYDLGQLPGVVVQSVTRDNPIPCDHFTTVIDVDGIKTVTVSMTSAELNEPVTDDENRAILKGWAKYQKSKGVTVPEMVNGQVFREIGVQAGEGQIGAGDTQ